MAKLTLEKANHLVNEGIKRVSSNLPAGCIVFDGYDNFQLMENEYGMIPKNIIINSRMFTSIITEYCRKLRNKEETIRAVYENGNRALDTRF